MKEFATDRTNATTLRDKHKGKYVKIPKVLPKLTELPFKSI